MGALRTLAWSLAVLGLVLAAVLLTACAQDPPPPTPATGHPWGVDNGPLISRA